MLIIVVLLLIVCNTFLIGRYCCKSSRHASLTRRDIELMSVGHGTRALHRLGSFEEPEQMYFHGRDPHNRHIYERVGTFVPSKKGDHTFASTADSGVSQAGSSSDYHRPLAVRNSSARSSRNRTLRRKPGSSFQDRYDGPPVDDTASEAGT